MYKQIRGEDNDIILSQMLALEVQQAREERSTKAILQEIVEAWHD